MHPDAIVDLLRTHAAADPSDLKEIQRRGEFYQSEWYTWQRRLDAALILVDVLQNNVKRLARQKDLYTSYMSPVRLLPAEILSLIFAYASAEDPDFDVFPNGRCAVPLTSHALTQVCKFWRDIALQTQAMWRHAVVLRPHEGPDYAGYAVYHRVEQALKLYGLNLTQVYLHLPNYDSPTCKMIRDAILQKQDQLKALKLIGDVFGGSQPPYEVSVPVLEELLLSADLRQSESNTSVTFNAPNLAKLSVYYPLSFFLHLSLPWHQITYLSLGLPEGVMQWVSLATVLDLLQHFSCLINLHLVGMNIDYDPTPSDLSRPRLVTLPKLRFFELNDRACRTASVIATQTTLLAIHPWYSLLTHLSTPMLQQFDWIIPPDYSMSFIYSVQSINHFLMAAPYLRSIRVAICDFTDPPAGLRTGIIRLTGSKSDFPSVTGPAGFQWYSNEYMLKLAEQRNCPPCRSPKLDFDEGLISSVDDYIDRYLEGGEAYEPLKGHLEDETRRIRLDDVAQTSTAIMMILFGDGVGPVDCQRRLYLTI